MKKLLLAAAVVAAAGVITHEYFRRKSLRVFPHEGEWHEVETMDGPREFCAEEGYAAIYGFGSGPAGKR